MPPDFYGIISKYFPNLLYLICVLLRRVCIWILIKINMRIEVIFRKKLKKKELSNLNVICVISILLIVSLGAFTQSNIGISSATIVSVSPESSAVDVGNTLSVDILVDSNAIVHGFEIVLDYDEDLLDVLEVTEGSLLKISGYSTFWFVVANLDSVHVNDAILGRAEVNGPGQLFRIKFKAIKEGNSNLSFNFVDIRDMTNTTIPSKPINGYISIGLTSVKDEDSKQSYLSEEYFLAQNYPNPFNSSTQIEYSLPEETFVSLKIHNINGQLIKTLVEVIQCPGLQTTYWNGKDCRGMSVANGLYFYMLKTEKFYQTKVMLLLK